MRWPPDDPADVRSDTLNRVSGTLRLRGKSDPIDALAVARAALREPNLSRPRPDEQPFRDLKLLVDHRDDLVDERRRAQQRLRWHLHQLDPSFVVPAIGRRPCW